MNLFENLQILKENRYNEDNAATLLDNIKEDITKVCFNFMTSSKCGFSEDEVNDYFSVSTDVNDDSLIVYVGAELGYDSLYELSLKLNDVITLYDKNAYFDMEAPGRLVSYLYSM